MNAVTHGIYQIKMSSMERKDANQNNFSIDIKIMILPETTIENIILYGIPVVLAVHRLMVAFLPVFLYHDHVLVHDQSHRPCFMIIIAKTIQGIFFFVRYFLIEEPRKIK